MRVVPYMGRRFPQIMTHDCYPLRKPVWFLHTNSYTKVETKFRRNDSTRQDLSLLSKHYKYKSRTLGLAVSISSTSSSLPFLRSTSVASEISVIVACNKQAARTPEIVVPFTSKDGPLPCRYYPSINQDQSDPITQSRENTPLSWTARCPTRLFKASAASVSPEKQTLHKTAFYSAPLTGPFPDCVRLLRYSTTSACRSAFVFFS